MELKGNLISVREDARVLDATLRDGGLVNDFFFTDEFVRSLYAANTAAGVDYMEFGYKASKALFDREKFGKWKFCDDEDIRAIVGENENGPKICLLYTSQGLPAPQRDGGSGGGLAGGPPTGTADGAPGQSSLPGLLGSARRLCGAG